ncbi:MAG: hypothetical protein ACXW2F_05120, partial [Thermoanaerobaculia bacterium]
GIIIAFMAGVPFMAGFNRKIEDFSSRNPLYTGHPADVLALIPFAILIILLYMTGREKLLAHRDPTT